MNSLISTATANDLWHFFIAVLVIVIISITVEFLLDKTNKRYRSNNDARRFTATENVTN